MLDTHPVETHTRGSYSRETHASLLTSRSSGNVRVKIAGGRYECAVIIGNIAVSRLKEEGGAINCRNVNAQ